MACKCVYYYFQNANTDGALEIPDAYIAAFNTDNEEFWGTYFGGSGIVSLLGERGDHAVQAGISPNQNLYIVGTSASNKLFPTNCASPEFCYLNPTLRPGENPNDPNSAVDLDAFITKFDLSSIVSVKETAKNNGKSNNIVVYPNPASKRVILEYNLLETQEIVIRMLNTLGQVVYVESLGEQKGKFSRKLNVENLPSGIYLIQILEGDKTTSAELALQ